MNAGKDWADEELATLFKQATSVKAFHASLNVKQSKSPAWLVLRLERLGLDVEEIKASIVRRDASNTLVLRPKGSGREKASYLRRALFEMEVPFQCASCGQSDTWKGLPLTLHVEHIDGNFLNCRFENLCFLCPNCHTQTATYAGRNRRRIVKCADCDVLISKQSKRCQPCANAKLGRERSCPSYIEWPRAEWIVSEIQKSSVLAVSRTLGVSDNAIRKHLRKRGIDWERPSRVKRK